MKREMILCWESRAFRGRHSWQEIRQPLPPPGTPGGIGFLLEPLLEQGLSLGQGGVLPGLLVPNPVAGAAIYSHSRHIAASSPPRIGKAF